MSFQLGWPEAVTSRALSSMDSEGQPVRAGEPELGAGNWEEFCSDRSNTSDCPGLMDYMDSVADVDSVDAADRAGSEPRGRVAEILWTPPRPWYSSIEIYRTDLAQSRHGRQWLLNKEILCVLSGFARNRVAEVTRCCRESNKMGAEPIGATRPRNPDPGTFPRGQHENRGLMSYGSAGTSALSSTGLACMPST